MANRKKALEFVFFSTPIIYLLIVGWMFFAPVMVQDKSEAIGLNSVGLRTIEPLEPVQGLDPEKVRLGKDLFHEPRLSANSKVSCASCHNVQKGGSDPRPRSIGASGKALAHNSLSVFNVADSFGYYWDGRIKTLEQVINSAVTNPDKIGANWPKLIKYIEKYQSYSSRFEEVYKDKTKPKYVLDAIATYVRSLVTLNSKFDQYLRGDENALNEQEKRGYAFFKTYGCISCHQGKNIGGNMFQRFGTIVPYFDETIKNEKVNLGRYAVTGDKRDRNVFKVPSLRNVELTAPYYHDGSADSLEQAIAEMAYYQLGTPLEINVVSDIVAFLRTLTGETAREGRYGR